MMERRLRHQRRRIHKDSRDQRLMLRAIDQALGNYARAREIYAILLQNRANGRRVRPREIPDRRKFQRLDERFGDQERLRIIREESLRLSRVQIAQELRPRDRYFSQRVLSVGVTKTPNFLEVLFMDEASFSNTNILNRQNVRAYRNPRLQRIQQGRFTINVWITNNSLK